MIFNDFANSNLLFRLRLWVRCAVFEVGNVCNFNGVWWSRCKKESFFGASFDFIASFLGFYVLSAPPICVALAKWDFPWRWRNTSLNKRHESSFFSSHHRRTPLENCSDLCAALFLIFFCVRSDQRRQSSKMTVWRNLFQSSRISFDAFRLPFCPSLSSLLHSSDALFAFFLLYLVASWCCCCCFFFGVTTKNFYWRSSPPLPTTSSDCAFFRPSCLARTWCIGCTGEEHDEEAWSEKFIL